MSVRWPGEDTQSLAGKCPAFKEGYPFKNCKCVGDFVEKITQMRDTCKGKAAYTKFFNMFLRSLRMDRRSWRLARSKRMSVLSVMMLRERQLSTSENELG